MTVTISGIGGLASVGADPAQMFAGLCAGRDGRNLLRGFDRTKFASQHLYEVDDRETEGVDVPARASRLLVDAVEQAVKDAGLDPDLRDVPVLIGTGLRELRSAELWWRDGSTLDPGGLHFGTELRRRFGASDTHTIAGACSASLYALAMGSDLVRSGAAETVVVAGVDVVTESMFGQYDRLAPTPPERVLPLATARIGTVLGEGAGAVVLTAGPRPGGYGVLRGVSANCDAFHATAPDLPGVTGAIREAHRRAATDPSDVDLVLLHGTGTPLNDQVEIKALREAFGAAATRPLVTGIKSMTGHTAGSAGVLSLVVALLAMRNDEVPPITGLREPIAETEGLRLVHGTSARERTSVAEVHGFGFGGVNAVAIVEVSRP